MDNITSLFCPLRFGGSLIFACAKAKSMETLQTGDIVLVDEHPSSCCFRTFTSCIKSCTKSRYSHCAIVLKDYPVPGLFVWESSWHPDNPLADPSDHRVHKFGVQITPLSFYLSGYPGSAQVFVRRRKSPVTIAKATLDIIYRQTLDKPYDIWPCDWVAAKLRCRPRRTTARFWCSAFAAYFLVQTKAISADCDWSMVRAQDLSSSCAHPPFSWQAEYANDVSLERIRINK